MVDGRIPWRESPNTEERGCSRDGHESPGGGKDRSRGSGAAWDRDAPSARGVGAVSGGRRAAMAIRANEADAPRCVPCGIHRAETGDGDGGIAGGWTWSRPQSPECVVNSGNAARRPPATRPCLRFRKIPQPQARGLFPPSGPLRRRRVQRDGRNHGHFTCPDAGGRGRHAGYSGDRIGGVRGGEEWSDQNRRTGRPP